MRVREGVRIGGRWRRTAREGGRVGNKEGGGERGEGEGEGKRVRVGKGGRM